jgi:deoxycitidine kinase/deoxyguanosine kinase
MKTTIISIEGNIGSGKSTLFEKLKIHFANNKNIIFVREPVDIWESIQDENGTTILEKFYQDQIKYSFSFQIMAYISRINLLKETIKQNPGVTIITERSLYTDKMVFAKMLYDTHKIEYINYQIYLNLFDTFKNDFNVNNIIYQ